MEKTDIIQAKFIPCGKPTPLPELFALRAKAREELAELNTEKKALISSLAQKISQLKRKAKAVGSENGARKERQALIRKMLEVDLAAKAIHNESHLEGLETIKAVCLAVFGQSPESQKELLCARLKQSFLQLEDSGSIKVFVAPGFKASIDQVASNIAQIEESEEILSGTAILQTKSGKIEINVLDDLTEAFISLQQKLQQNL